MDSDDVQIVRVDSSSDCLCISRSKEKRTSTRTKRRRVDDDDCILVENTVKVDKEASDKKTDGAVCCIDEPDKDYAICTITKKSKPLSSTLSNSSPPSKMFTTTNSNSQSAEGLAVESIINSFCSTETYQDLALPPSSGELSADVCQSDSSSLPPFHVPPPPNLLTDIMRTPKCWTVCPHCPVGAQRKFHLVDVLPHAAEWGVVSAPLMKDGFVVSRVRRIQNESLWQRLCYEKQLMLREKRDVNEQLLYHTSRGSVEVIAEEGLDIRLSHVGNFGSGIYFSDDPVKCDSYWRPHHPMGFETRHMFCCRVLLGDIKEYPHGTRQNLRREPRKEKWKPGDPNKYYDSVKGNITGSNEFVVYNMYRVMPEYVVYYTLPMDVVNAPVSNVPPPILTFPLPPTMNPVQAPSSANPPKKRKQKKR